VTGGDVLQALTTSKPRQIPLPDEPQGESITYSADGRSLLTVSETSDQPAGTRPVIQRYPLPDRPAVPASPSATPPSSPGSATTPSSPGSVAPASPSPAGAQPTSAVSSSQTPFNYIAVLVGGILLLGVILAVVLVLRRRRRG
jgi:hypothetical protein